MWINPKNLQIFTTHSEIRSAFNNVSLPKNITEEVINNLNLKPLKITPKPNFDISKNIIAGIPVFENNEWVQVWNVTDATTEEITKRILEKATKIRKLRNIKLINSDWTQLEDAPVDKVAWATYRQALRDLPQAEGFPDVDMPTSPDANNQIGGNIDGN